MASPAPSATRATDATGVESQTPTTASPARLASEVIAVTTSDEFLLELGEALGGQASVRPVDSVANALEHLGTSRRAQLIAFDMRGVTDVRADIERARAKAPHVALLAFAEASAEQATAASLKGSDVFAILPIPVDRAKTAAIFEGALAAAAEKRAAARGAAAQKPAGAGRAEAPITVTTASPPEASPAADGERKLPMVALVAGGAGLLVAIAVTAWFLARGAAEPAPAAAAAPAATSQAPADATDTQPAAIEAAPVTAAPVTLVQGSLDELLEKARLAMRERRFTEPVNDSALVYLRSALAVDASNAEAKDGLARIGGVLIARVDEAVSAGQYDEAATSLAALKSALPGDARVKLLESRLMQAQVNRALGEGNLDRAAALVRAAQASGAVAGDVLARWRTDVTRRQDEVRVRRFTDLANERLRDGRLVEPANDNARHYVQQLREVAPTAANTQRLIKDLSAAYLRKARESALAGRSNESERWLGEARAAGVTPAEITAFQREVASSRQRAAAAEADRFAQLARERIKEGRLIEPSGDSAAHYLTALQSSDSSHAALAPASRDLAARLLERAGTAAREGRVSQVEADLAAARRWGADGRDIQAVQQLAATAKPQASGPRTASAKNLKRTRYIAPEYPSRALEKGASGSVIIEYTVDVNGATRDVRVSAADPPVMFDKAALAAVRRWRYEPVVVDGVPVEIPTRAVIRFEAPKN